MRAVATEACRRAKNGQVFLDRVADETGIAFDIISPETEADLAQNHLLLDAGLRELELMGTKRVMLDTRIQSLEVQLTQAEMRSYDPTDTDAGLQQFALDPRARRLAQLQRELDELRIHYSEAHPTFLRKKRELEDLLSCEPMEFFGTG